MAAICLGLNVLIFSFILFIIIVFFFFFFFFGGGGGFVHLSCSFSVNASTLYFHTSKVWVVINNFSVPVYSIDSPQSDKCVSFSSDHFLQWSYWYDINCLQRNNISVREKCQGFPVWYWTLKHADTNLVAIDSQITGFYFLKKNQWQAVYMHDHKHSIINTDYNAFSFLHLLISV